MGLSVAVENNVTIQLQKTASGGKGGEATLG